MSNGKFSQIFFLPQIPHFYSSVIGKTVALITWKSTTRSLPQNILGNFIDSHLLHVSVTN